MATRRVVKTAIKTLINSGLLFPKNADPVAMAEIWCRYLKDVEDEQFAACMNSYMTAGDQYWPSIGRLRQFVPQIARRAIESQDESDRAWASVMGAVSRRGASFDLDSKTPSNDPVKAKRLRALKHAVRCIGGWRRLCLSRESEHMSLRAAFRRAYNAFIKAEAVDAIDPNKRIATHHPTSAALQAADVFKEIKA